MVAIGKQAWLALMNRKSPTAPRRSPVQTRPRLLTEYPARPGAACSHAAAAPTRRVPWTTNQRPPPPVGPLACRTQQPRRRSTAPWVRTPEQDPREIAQHGPDRSSDDETQANTADAFWASGAPLAKASGCPRNRVNPSELDRAIACRSPRPGALVAETSLCRARLALPSTSELPGNVGRLGPEAEDPGSTPG